MRGSTAERTNTTMTAAATATETVAAVAIRNGKSACHRKSAASDHGRMILEPRMWQHSGGSSATLPEVGLPYEAGSIPILSFTAAAIRCVQPR